MGPGKGRREPGQGTGRDPDHSVGEERFIIFGMSTSGRLLVARAFPNDDAVNKALKGLLRRGG